MVEEYCDMCWEGWWGVLDCPFCEGTGVEGFVVTIYGIEVRGAE